VTRGWPPPRWRPGGALDAPAASAFALAAAAVVLGATVDGFASIRNLETMHVAALPLLLLATGQTFVLLGGAIDLSAPALVGLASVAGGVLVSGSGSLAAAGLAALVMGSAGVAAGAVNGACAGWLRMPSFMVTLTTGMFSGGLAVWLAQRVAGTDTIYRLPPPLVAAAAPAVAAAATGAAVLAAHPRSGGACGRWGSTRALPGPPACGSSASCSRRSS
jgi:ribose transport system permease protein